MTSGPDKIIVSKNSQHYIYCSVHDSGSSGTAIDFAQKVIEPGCDLGRVRQLLRPFLNAGYLSSIRQEYQGRYASDIKPSEIDLAGVAARYSRFVPVAKPHPYLCGVRGIPFDLLQSPRLHGRVRHCPHRGSVVFPHWGCPTQSGSNDRLLVGYEIKGPSVNMYSKGGKKGLFISAGMKGDNTLAFAESGLDALSYMAVHANHQAHEHDEVDYPWFASQFRGLLERFAVLENAMSAIEQSVATANSPPMPPTPREYYSVLEFAAEVERGEYTVREWCRLARINAKKCETGRGEAKSWKIPTEELGRYRDHGLLPARYLR